MSDEQSEGVEPVHCPDCGAVMEKRTKDTAYGGFGSGGVAAVSTRAFYVCPGCGLNTGKDDL